MSKRGIALLLALGLLCLVACGRREEPSGPRVYYAARAAEGYELAAVQGEIWTDAPDQVSMDELMGRMLTAPENENLYVIYPEGTRLLDWSVQDGMMTLNMSEPYGELSGISLTLANYCLVLTAAQLEGVERVTVTVEGQPLPEGRRGPFRAGDILLSGELQDPAEVTFRLCFPGGEEGSLVWEQRKAELYSDTVSDRATAVIRLLTQRGGNQEEQNPFQDLENDPEVQISQGICRVTLTRSWATVLAGQEGARRAFVASLCEVDGIEGVTFLWEGDGAETLTGVFRP